MREKKGKVTEGVKALRKIIHDYNLGIDKKKLDPLDIIYVTRKLDQYSDLPSVQHFISQNKNFIYYLASHSLEAAEIILGKRGLGQYLTATETAMILTKTVTAFMQQLIKQSLKAESHELNVLDQLNQFIKGTNFTVASLLKDNKAFDILYHNANLRALIQHIDPMTQFSFLAEGKYDNELKQGSSQFVAIASIIKNNYKNDISIKKFLNSNPHFLFMLAKEDFNAAKVLFSSKALAKKLTAKEIGQIIYKFRDRLYEEAKRNNENIALNYYQLTNKLIDQTGHSLKTLLKTPEVANLFKSNKHLSEAVNAMKQDVVMSEKNRYKSQL